MPWLRSRPLDRPKRRRRKSPEFFCQGCWAGQGGIAQEPDNRGELSDGRFGATQLPVSDRLGENPDLSSYVSLTQVRFQPMVPQMVSNGVEDLREP